MATSWQDELEWFKKQYGGNEDIAKQAYAAEIVSKEKSGTAFSNKAAADQFKLDNANFFGGAKPQNNTQSENTYRPTNDDFMKQAQNYANMQVNPQIEALQRALSQAETNAQNQRQSINAAYAGVPERLSEAASEAKEGALESAISRGGGRSGVVDWQDSKIEKARQEQLGQAEAQKAAQLSGVANTLANFQQSAQDQLSSLAANKGNMQQMYLDTLLNQNLDRQFNYDQFDFQKSQAEIGNKFNQDQFDWQKSQAEIVNQFNQDQFDWKKNVDNRDYQASQAAESWKRKYQEATKGGSSGNSGADTQKAEKEAREFAIKLATVDGILDEAEYNKIYNKLMGKNALDDPYVKSVLQIFNPFNFMPTGGSSGSYNEDELRKAGLIE